MMDGDLSQRVRYGYVLDDCFYSRDTVAVGFFALPGVGELIHILLVIAVIIAVYRLLTGRHILSGEKR
jgi:hypothetical protein